MPRMVSTRPAGADCAVTGTGPVDTTLPDHRAPAAGRAVDERARLMVSSVSAACDRPSPYPLPEGERGFDERDADRQDLPCTMIFVMTRFCGTPLTVTRTTSPAASPFSVSGSLTRKPMVMDGMNPAICSWVSTTTPISGTVARTTPSAVNVCSTPGGTARSRAPASSSSSCAAWRPHVAQPMSTPTARATFTSSTTRQSLIVSVHVLGGWRRRRLAGELLELGHERGGIGPSLALSGDPARPDVAGTVDQELHVLGRRAGPEAVG